MVSLEKDKITLHSAVSLWNSLPQEVMKLIAVGGFLKSELILLRNNLICSKAMLR